LARSRLNGEHDHHQQQYRVGSYNGRGGTREKRPTLGDKQRGKHCDMERRIEKWIQYFTKHRWWIYRRRKRLCINRSDTSPFGFPLLCAHCHGDSADLHTEHIAHANASAELAPWTLEMSWIASCGEGAGTTTTTVIAEVSSKCLLMIVRQDVWVMYYR
jgi:hypothetical protein